MYMVRGPFEARILRTMVKRFALVFAALPLLAACESLSRGSDQVRELVNHHEEQVTYPSLLDVPAKPLPSNTASDRERTVQSLKADQAEAAAQGDTLRDDAANMQRLPVPGEPPAPAGH